MTHEIQVHDTRFNITSVAQQGLGWLDSHSIPSSCGYRLLVVIARRWILLSRRSCSIVTGVNKSIDQRTVDDEQAGLGKRR